MKFLNAQSMKQNKKQGVYLQTKKYLENIMLRFMKLIPIFMITKKNTS